MIGGQFQVASCPDFHDATNLYEIKQNPGEHFNEVITDKKEPYQYVRYLAPKASFGNVAELEFYESPESTTRLKGTILGTDGSLDRFTGKEAAVDSNTLTMFNALVPDSCWVGLDLGEKKRIGKIRFIARNDMNSIQVGHQYELFYWDDGWNSLGLKTADSTSLTYEKVPANCLYWLKCYTKGAEERIFTYENGTQVWW
jgi:hypothetical protein